MSHWYLAFDGKITVDAVQGVLANLGPVTTEVGDWEGGDPRDGQARTITVMTPQIRVEIIQQDLIAHDSPEFTSIKHVLLQADTFAGKRAAWHAVHDAFTELGLVERTLVSSPSFIVDDAVAAGETTFARRLRTEITEAWVIEAAKHRDISLHSPRADNIEAILAAYLEPESFNFASLSDCELDRYPEGLARFPNLEYLSLTYNRFDGDALRGVSLAKLRTLNITVKHLAREDVAGFPNLEKIINNDQVVTWA